MIRLERGGAFVELSRQGPVLARTWGPVPGGVAGARSDVRASAEEAEAALLDQLRRLERKGFRVGHHHAAMEEAIVAAPDDPPRRLVYADWLTERGDPRGELITRMAGGVPIEDLLARHPHHLLPAWAAAFSLEWRLGFVSTVDLGDDLSALPRLLRHPSFMVVEALRVGPRGVHAGTLEQALRHRPPTLRGIDARGVKVFGTLSREIPGLLL